HHFSLEAGATRVEDLLVGQAREGRQQELALCVRAAGGEHAAAALERDADSGLADTASSCVDEHALASTKSCTHNQGVVCGCVRHWHGGCVLESPVSRHLPRVLQWNMHNSCDGIVSHTHDALAAVAKHTCELETNTAWHLWSAVESAL